MKNALFLVIGLFVAGLAAWAVPKELKEKPVKMDILTTVVAMDNAIEVETPFVVQDHQLVSDQTNSRAALSLQELIRPAEVEVIPRNWRKIDYRYRKNRAPVNNKNLGSWKYQNRIRQRKL